MDSAGAAKLRVHLVTQADPLYVPAFFEEFFKLVEHEPIELTGVDITPALNQQSRFGALRKALALFGWTGTLRIALEQFNNARSGVVQQLCAEHRVPYHEVADINSDSEVARIAALRPDVLFSVAASQIFRTKLLDVPRLYALNVHNGKLPRYRGMLPVFWQLYEGADAITISVHLMDRKLDKGLIALERSVPLAGERSLHALFKRCKVEAARVVVDALRQVKAGTLAPWPQTQADETYFTFPTAQQARELRARGFRIP